MSNKLAWCIHSITHVLHLHISELKCDTKKKKEQVECLRLWWMCIGEFLGFIQSKCNYSAALTYSRLSACHHSTGVQSVSLQGRTPGVLELGFWKANDWCEEMSPSKLIECQLEFEEIGLFECLKSHFALIVVYYPRRGWVRILTKLLG